MRHHYHYDALHHHHPHLYHSNSSSSSSNGSGAGRPESPSPPSPPPLPHRIMPKECVVEKFIEILLHVRLESFASAYKVFKLISHFQKCFNIKLRSKFNSVCFAISFPLLFSAHNQSEKCMKTFTLKLLTYFFLNNS